MTTTRSALQNASSIASMVLTTEALIAGKPEKKPAGGGVGGAPRDLGIGFDAGRIEVVELDGRIVEELKPVVNDLGQRAVRLKISRFGIRTLRFSALKLSPPPG